MRTLFNTFVAHLRVDDIDHRTCLDLNKAIDEWLSQINGTEIERSQPTVTVWRERILVLVTVKAEVSN